MKPKMKPYRNIESREIGKSIYQEILIKKKSYVAILITVEFKKKALVGIIMDTE